MKKNINKSTAKKLEISRQDKKEQTKLLKGKVQRLVQKLEQSAPAVDCRLAKATDTNRPVTFFIGIDLGDQKSNYCMMDEGKEIRAEDKLATTTEAFKAYFSSIPRSRIALEVGTHSPWVSELLESLGHEVYVANPRKMESIKKSKRKNDKEDARKLARLVRADPELLYPIRHRGLQAREDLILLRARDAAVRSRTMLINSARGLAKSCGERLPGGDAKYVNESLIEPLSEPLRQALGPLLAQVRSLTEQIEACDQQIRQLAQGFVQKIHPLRSVTSLSSAVACRYQIRISLIS